MITIMADGGKLDEIVSSQGMPKVQQDGCNSAKPAGSFD